MRLTAKNRRRLWDFCQIFSQLILQMVSKKTSRGYSAEIYERVYYTLTSIILPLEIEHIWIHFPELKNRLQFQRHMHVTSQQLFTPFFHVVSFQLGINYDEAASASAGPLTVSPVNYHFTFKQTLARRQDVCRVVNAAVICLSIEIRWKTGVYKGSGSVNFAEVCQVWNARWRCLQNMLVYRHVGVVVF